MTVCIKFICVGDKFTFKIENVPFTATVGQVINKVSQLNKMVDDSKIRLINKGHILQRHIQLSSIVLDEPGQLIMFVDGIPGHEFKKKAQEEVSEKPKAPNSSPLPTTPFQAKTATSQKPHKPKLRLFAILFYILVILATIMNVLAVSMEIAPDGSFSFQFDFSIIYKLILIGFVVAFTGHIIFIILSTGGVSLLKECFKAFFVSFLPNWDENAFKQEHGIHN